MIIIILDLSKCCWVCYPKEIFLVVHHPVVADHKIQRSTLPPWVLTTLKTNSKTKPVRNIFGKKLRLNKAKKLLNTPCVLLLLYYCWCHLWIHIRADMFQNYFKVPAGIFEKIYPIYISCIFMVFPSEIYEINLFLYFLFPGNYPRITDKSKTI